MNQFEQLPCQNKIVFLGDSLTDWGEWGELLEHSNIVNRGVAGDTVAGLLNRLEPIIRSRPQQLYLMIGINDLIRKKSVSETVQSYRAILEKLQKEAPQTKVFIQSLLPVNSKKYRAVTKEKLVTFNRQLQDLAFEFSDTYIDLYSAFSPKNIDQYTVDGLHLNGNGYLLWKDMIKPYLLKDEVNELSDVPPL